MSGTSFFGDNWPPTVSACPYCHATLLNVPPCRWHDDGVVLRCRNCGCRHTRRQGDDYPYPYDVLDAYAALGPKYLPRYDDNEALLDAPFCNCPPLENDHAD
jgi:hypothetical protein